MNLPRINQNWLLLLVAILLGGGAAFLGNRMVQRHMQALDEEARRANQPIPVVVAKRDLLPGDALTSDNFAVRQVPREFVNADAMTPEGFGQLEQDRDARMGGAARQRDFQSMRGGGGFAGRGGGGFRR